jgi:WxL domain surface cell wall-binding
MRKITPFAGVLVAAGIVASLGSLPAQADTVGSTLSGGTLTSSTSAPTLSAVTLDGSNTQTSTGVAPTAWTVTDARGTGAAWTLSVSATDLTSAPGTVETTVRTIPASALTVTPGDVTAGSGSDPVDNITDPALVLSNTSQALVSASGPDKGTYTFTPSFSLAIPANAYRSNYTGAVGSSDLNPYTSTLTYTIG